MFNIKNQYKLFMEATSTAFERKRANKIKKHVFV